MRNNINIITNLDRMPKLKKVLIGLREGQKVYGEDRVTAEDVQNLLIAERIILEKLPLNELEVGTEVNFSVPKRLYNFVKEDFSGVWTKYNDSCFSGDYCKLKVMQNGDNKEFYLMCSWSKKDSNKKQEDLFEQNIMFN